MANVTRNFTQGKMNKMVDERLVPDGQYVDALNIRMGSTEGSEIGVVENSKGNERLTQLQFLGVDLSSTAKCIGAFEDGAFETIYWFVHDPAFTGSGTSAGIVDLVVSYNTELSLLTYHVISVGDPDDATKTTLNFDPDYLITGVNKVENLLFFTDNFNPPRQINVRNDYGNPVAGVDGFTYEEILVIKKPPTTSPTVTPVATSSQDNFLEDRFISFAYRYKYQDGEYSATSQFSDPSFIPSIFKYDIATALNQGMLNSTNTAEVVYNSGGPLVKEVDLLFKDMNSSVIKVIETFNKVNQGLADNTNYTFVFNNSKIFTILPTSEILRLYDNVPHLAQAQTMMGNRLMYGNYYEQYDLKRGGVPTKFEYSVTTTSEEIGRNQLEGVLTSGNYTINGSQTIAESVLEVDLDGQDLIQGAILNILIRFEHSSWTGQAPFPVDTTQEQAINFSYILPQGFASVFDLASSVDFSEKIGVATNIQTVANSCNGLTLTDLFNCVISNELSGMFKFQSGISAINQAIEIITTPASSVIKFQLPAMSFVDDVTTPTQTVFEYYKITLSDVVFQDIGQPSSLHSNRGYEIGIVYMDEFNRATSAQVSLNNTASIPCSSSEFKNQIQVTIPTSQIAPEWATRYKFCIKPDKQDFNTIYSQFFFRDPASGSDYFLLEGQNSQKIELGDELIVKTDTQGPLDTCTFTTVLEKDAKTKEFLDPAPVDINGTEIPVPAGTYMKLRANNFSTEVGDLPVVAYGEKNSKGSSCRIINYPVDTEDPANPGSYIDYTLPAGTKVKIVLRSYRRGNEDSLFGNVPKKMWKVSTNLTASQEYPSFKAWFEGDNIAGVLEGLADDEGTGVEGPNYSSTYQSGNNRPCNVGQCYSNFYQSGGRTYFVFKSSLGYGGNKKNASARVDIEVIRSSGTVVFESKPLDSAPNIWYESSKSYAINNLGEHQGNEQNQVIASNIPAIIKTAFFNCYAFGNGVESWKIQDSIIGKELVLGNRALTTTVQDYKTEHRFSDITYSGIYNEEGNVNKLNEFNAGLLNFKPLEQSFGPVMKLFARETDVLTLQEDKISYVLSGKNLLSDAGGGDSLTSVPQVLGTQLARIEEYGISFNPESFSQWGPDKYFTDGKRGVVLQLTGTSAQNDRITAISAQGMRPWFRDLFNNSLGTQKLGGYDTYMNEYVLSSNQRPIPLPIECNQCGITQQINLVNQKATFDYCVDVGETVGVVDIDYTVASLSGTFNISALYDGNTVTTGNVTTSGKLSFNKNKILVDEVKLNLGTSGSAIITITVSCPKADVITIKLIHLSSDNDAGLTIHDEYRWVDGTFQSPLQSEAVTFATGTYPVVSLFEIITGPQGGGVIPTNGSTITMKSNKFSSDNYVFDIAQDDFKYLRSDTVYNNNSADIGALLAASSNATPINVPTNGNVAYTADFTMPNTGEFLYLIWDYRTSTPLDLCFGASATIACCECGDTGNTGSKWGLSDCDTGDLRIINDPNSLYSVGDVVQYQLAQGGFIRCGEIIASSTLTPTAFLYGTGVSYVCGDTTHCNISDGTGVTCTEYTVSTSSPQANSFSYIACDGTSGGGSIGGVGGYDQETFCAQTGTVNQGLNSLSTGGSC
tara:strand:- start:5242 stop:10065 length:4824 start_codon:yes stop_codon:yes gene_type:complete